MRGSKQAEATRWVLAFDASCASCREISVNVARASAGKLDVLPLGNPEVRSWRVEHFGAEPPHVPTLIRVRPNDVRAWTGPSMAPVLVRRLGTRATVRVLTALGTLRAQPTDASRPAGRDMGRAQFFRLCAGAAVGAGIVLHGQTPAFAASDRTRARAWVEANRHALPQHYEEVTALPMSHRREVFKASSPRVRSRLFTRQLTRYRAEHTARLTPEQRDVLDRGIALVSHEPMFAERVLSTSTHTSLEALRKDGARAFGSGEAAALFAALTPPAALGFATRSDTTPDTVDAPGTTRDWEDCTCAYASDYCIDHECDQGNFCDHTDGGCGSAWLYDCDGLCL